jgi:hypothetical protein
MIDGAFAPPPWSNAGAPNFIALRLSDAEATRDGLPVGAGALTSDNPSLEVSIRTVSGAPLGSIQVWAGGEFQSVVGPVPEPGCMLMVLVGVQIMLLRRIARNGCGHVEKCNKP